MNFPLFKFGFFGDEVSLVLAFVIGIGFGFALERAGFGNARLLAAQFYFTDMRVLKVMFSAIVTAMFGVYFFGLFGILDISLIYTTDTFMLPQVIGGLILGIGFVIGGYCPGTSAVSLATGRIDGLVYFIGVAAGVFVFGELFPLIENFFVSGSMGNVSLPGYFNLSYGFVVFAVAIMALGAFIAAEWGEKKMAKKAEGK
ncbi:MAG: YeeE/YedE family protein [Ignavibacteriales bacterium]|nr:YeeE/YedE family protein [Ignavibacteriales bacterium]MCF8435452.1 YeeE/YedE family protein [Ignavibacteriales bacterium]